MKGLVTSVLSRIQERSKRRAVSNKEISATASSSFSSSLQYERDDCIIEMTNDIEKLSRKNSTNRQRKTLPKRLRRKHYNNNNYEECPSLASTECTSSSVGTTQRRALDASVAEIRIPQFVVDEGRTGNVEILSLPYDTDTRKQQQLPQRQPQPLLWKYSSNHVMINQERSLRNIHPLIRLSELDQLARMRAEDMAQNGRLFYATQDCLQLNLGSILSSDQLEKTCVTENICKGTAIIDIHNAMMTSPHSQEYSNLLDHRFKYFGMASVRSMSPHYDIDCDGIQETRVQKIYLCQIFL